MNERIKELEKQSYVVIDYSEHCEYGSDGSPMTQTVFDKEKFAELIIRECVNVSDEVSMDDTVGYALLEHFGVEQ